MPEVNPTAKKPARMASDTFNAATENTAKVLHETIQGAEATAKTVNSAANETAKTMFPQMDMQRVEIPAAYRDMAERSIAQAKQSYERARAVTEQASEMMETTFNAATRSMSEYTLRMMETMRANTNANFDFARSLLSVKSTSEAIELSTAHTRKQLEAMTTQGKDLASLAQKLSTETVEPIRSGMDKAMRAAA